MTRPAPPFTPRLMGAAEAAVYLGVSATTLRAAPITPRQWGGRVLYDRFDLDAWASSLPYRGEDQGGDACDRAFGLAGGG